MIGKQSCSVWLYDETILTAWLGRMRRIILLWASGCAELQVKNRAPENILLENKVSTLAETVTFQTQYFANHLCSSYSPFPEQCLSFALPEAKLRWGKLERGSASAGLVPCACITVQGRCSLCQGMYCWCHDSVWLHSFPVDVC